MDPQRPGPPVLLPVLLYDGVCGLCDGLVRWVIRRDQKGIIRFASLQSARGKGLAHEAGIPMHEVEGLHTVYLLDASGAYARSEAIRRLLLRLPSPWRWLTAFFVFPVAWNDFLYSGVARLRYRIFGKRDSCRIPSPEERDRFLE